MNPEPATYEGAQPRSGAKDFLARVGGTVAHLALYVVCWVGVALVIWVVLLVATALIPDSPSGVQQVVP